MIAHEKTMKCFIVLLVLCVADTLADEDQTLGMNEANPASSCDEIYLLVGELLTSTG